MLIILLGPPGSGKGTQSDLLSRHYKIHKISVGDILRNFEKIKKYINNDSLLEVKSKIRSGRLIDNNLIINLVIDEIKNNDLQQKGIILDGYPRTISQAVALEKLKIKCQYVFRFILSEDLIYKRVLGRMVHSSSGRIYHKIFNPPKIKGKDDYTGDSLEVRSDDKKKFIKNRLLEYESAINPVISFYERKFSLKEINYFEINADQDKFIINKKLIRLINS